MPEEHPQNRLEDKDPEVHAVQYVILVTQWSFVFTLCMVTMVCEDSFVRNMVETEPESPSPL